MSNHTIPEIEWNEKATFYADPISMAYNIIESLHDLGDEIEMRRTEGSEDDLEFIDGMISAYTSVLTMMGVANIPVIEDNC